MITFRRKARGQALVTVVLFALVLFSFMGLGIDSGMLYLERRHLQNVADAACLAATTEFGLGSKDPAVATTAAYNYIINNVNENAKAAFDLTGRLNTSYIVNDDGVVDGASLIRGIEISGTDVRVAVNFPAFTYFMRLGGIETYNVMARAHCGATEGGGVLPIAVVRVPGYDADAPCDPAARVGIADPGVSLPQLNGNGPDYLIVRDVLQRVGETAVAQCDSDGDGSTAIGSTTLSSVGGGSAVNDGSTPVSNDCAGGTKRNWFNWPALGDPVAKTGMYRAPCTPAGMPNNIANWKVKKVGSTTYVPLDANAGYPLLIAGNEAYPNVGNISFTGPVLLDLRNIGGSTIGGAGPLYYNGTTASTATNVWKDLIAKYIRTYYPGPPVLIGQDLAIVNGVNTGSILDAIDDRFNGGEIVTALMYNGVHYEKPNYSVAVVCKPGANCNNASGNEPKLAVRNNPAAMTSDCKYHGDGFIGDVSYPGYPTNYAASPPSPAEYLVSLTPDPARVGSTAAAATIELRARFSGVNNSSIIASGTPGGPLGDIKVRWVWGSGSTGWQAPWELVNVPMPLVDANGDGKWDAAKVTLQVIQTAVENVPCAAAPGGTVDVPMAVRGAMVVQVIGRSTSTSVYHSDYGKLGLRNFPSADYYFSYKDEPSAVLVAGTAKTLKPELQVQDAGSGSILKWQAPNISRFNNWASSCSINWFKDGSWIGTYACGSGPAGFSAKLDKGPGNSPSLEIEYTGDASTAGQYALDLQLSESGLVHTSRFYLHVETELNNSINSWATVVCHINIQIMTDLSGSSTPNAVWARPVSGCEDPDTISMGLTSRLISW